MKLWSFDIWQNKVLESVKCFEFPIIFRFLFIFDCFRLFVFRFCFDMFGFVGHVLLYFLCALYYKLLFLVRLSDSLSISVYRYILICFDILEKCPRSVNNFCTKYLFVIWWDLGGPKWSPPPPPSPASMSRFPSGATLRLSVASRKLYTYMNTLR